MNADEIVRGLREMLPPQEDYAKLVCAEGFACGQYYVWTEPEPYVISEAANLIESLEAQLAESQRRERADEFLHKKLGKCAVLRTIYETPESCSNCMEHLSLEWSFCPECGRPTDWANSEPKEAQ